LSENQEEESKLSSVFGQICLSSFSGNDYKMVIGTDWQVTLKFQN